MLNEFGPLAAAAALWFGIHPGLAGSPLRTAIVDRTSEKAFRALFALLSLGSLVWLIRAYGNAPAVFLWVAPAALRFIPLILVPIAFIMLIGAFTVPNPTSVGGEKALERPEPARGVVRVTRHPFLWGVAFWAMSHLLVNGDVASLLFFGSLALTAWVGTRDIDRKRARAAPETWSAFTGVTSNVPFGAIVAGRNRLVLRELVLPVCLGLIAAGAMIHFHAKLFGVSPLP